MKKAPAPATRDAQEDSKLPGLPKEACRIVSSPCTWLWNVDHPDGANIFSSLSTFSHFQKYLTVVFSFCVCNKQLDLESPLRKKQRFRGPEYWSIFGFYCDFLVDESWMFKAWIFYAFWGFNYAIVWDYTRVDIGLCRRLFRCSVFGKEILQERIWFIQMPENYGGARVFLKKLLNGKIRNRDSTYMH